MATGHRDQSRQPPIFPARYGKGAAETLSYIPPVVTLRCNGVTIAALASFCMPRMALPFRRRDTFQTVNFVNFGGIFV